MELPRWFPEERITGFCCASWLMDPQLGEYLPADSNILRFQRRFEIIGDGFPANEATMTFIFRRAGEIDLDVLPQRSALERGFVEHIRRGGSWHIRIGRIPADAIRN